MSCECHIPESGIWVTLKYSGEAIRCPKINDDGSVQFIVSKQQLYAMQANVNAAIENVRSVR